jgi:exonuclease III
VGLAIKKSIAQRVYAINKIEGRAIMADLHFKNKTNVRIIVIYMPANSDDKEEKKKEYLLTKRSQNGSLVDNITKNISLF